MKLTRHLLARFTLVAAVAGVVGAGVVLPAVASAQDARILTAPPAPRYEVIGVRPGPYHVWQAGTWAWQPDGHYGWHPGRWVVPPQGHTVWVRDEWVSYGGAWHMVPGHWRAVGERIPTAMQRLTVTAEPPAEQAETVGVVGVGQAWVKGHWSWDGARYVWVPGHTMLVPEGYRSWEPGHWYPNAGHWFYRTGYWR
jgi:hypothetical protein